MQSGAAASAGSAGDVLAIDQDRPRIDVREAREQLGQGRLARAGRADQADVLARRDVQVKAGKQRRSLSVREVHPEEIDAPGADDELRSARCRHPSELRAPPEVARGLAKVLEGLLQVRDHLLDVEQDQIHRARLRPVVERQQDPDDHGQPVKPTREDSICNRVVEKTLRARKSAATQSVTRPATWDSSSASIAWLRTVVRFAIVSAITPMARVWASALPPPRPYPSAASRRGRRRRSRQPRRATQARPSRRARRSRRPW